MKTHTREFKENVPLLGRELDSKITYTIDGVTTELGSEELNSVSPHYEGAILKSVMRQLDVDSNVEIPLGTILTYEFGVKVNDEYEYINYGNYVVYRVEKKEDTNSWQITCYDKMLYAMKNYEKLISKNLFDISQIKEGYITTTGTIYVSTPNDEGYVRYIPVQPNTTYTFDIIETPTTYSQWLGIAEYSEQNESSFLRNSVRAMANVPYTFTTGENANYLCVSGRNMLNATKIQLEKGNSITSYRPFFAYPLSLRDYLTILCDNIGLTFKNSNDTFVNYNKEITKELYLDSDGNPLDYTFRKVLDELAEATASTICINEEDDELEIRYINETQGKNLLKGTSGEWTNWYTPRYDAVNQSTYLYFTTDNLDKFKKGQVLTLSFDVEFDNVSGTSGQASGGRWFPQIVINQTLDTMHNGQWFGFSNASPLYTNPTDGVHHMSHTFTLNEDRTNYVRFGFVPRLDYWASGKWRIKNVQLELGSEETFYVASGDTIDEEYLKDVNVNFGEKVGPINTIILSRSADSDKISQSIPSDLADEDKIAIQITDNQIMNDNNRADFIPEILNKLYGLEYYINDFSSTGICYYNLCDKYNVKIGENIYSCIMFNDEVNVTQGLEEFVYTDLLEENQTNHDYVSDDDRKTNQTYIIAKKNEGKIEAVVSSVQEISTRQNNDYQELLNKFQPIDSTLNKIDSIERSVQQLQTDTYTKTEIQQIANGTGVDGTRVTAVITTSGTFDEDGMTYEKSNAPTKSTINEIGVNVKDQNDSSLLFAGYVDANNAPQDLLNKYGDYANQTIVGTDNIIVNNYLNIGTHSRIQDYGNGTGIFWR